MTDTGNEPRVGLVHEYLRMEELDCQERKSD